MISSTQRKLTRLLIKNNEAEEPQLDPGIIANAGIGSITPLLNTNVDKMDDMMDDMIALNITALTRLTYVAAHAFVARGTGTIVNIASVTAYRPRRSMGFTTRPEPTPCECAQG